MSATGPDWPLPSPRVGELIRRATTALLGRAERLFGEVDGAVLAVQPALPAADPQLAAAISASTRSNLTHWATANITEPGARVPPNIVPETVELAREIVRRGFDDAGLAGYRVGQNVAWQQFMDVAFDLTGDPEELREMLEVAYRSAATFIDEMLAALRGEMERERELLSSRARSERLEAVMLVLDNAPIGVLAASRRLRYELDRRHLAAVVWSDAVGPRDPEAMAGAADRVGELLGDGRPIRPLTTMPNPSTLWAWFAVSAGAAAGVEHPAFGRRMSPAGDIRVAIGRPATGAEGFRASHRDAIETQRMMRLMPAARRSAVTVYADVELASLAGAERGRATAFVRATLAELLGAEPVLRETLRTYIGCDFNVSQTGRRLFTHRNTVLGRVKRAEQLLGVPLAGHGLQVGLALELAHWLDLGA
jgi:DNA-binding PucR family transcriptional regulator